MRFLNIDRDLLARLALTCAVLLVVVPAVACGSAADDAGMGEGAAGEAADADPGAGGNENAANAGADDHAADAGAGEHAEGEDEGHMHPADGMPTRDEEAPRDEYSKPLEVFALTGIETGATVVDIGAGAGYNTYFLSDLVGTDGMIYAVRGNEGLQMRLDSGDMSDAENVTIVGSSGEVPDGSADAVLMIREYHLAQDRPAMLAEATRMLKPGGRVAVVEVRLGDSREGYNHDSHRSGEDTVIAEFSDAGFELVTESDLLYLEGDDYSAYGGATGTRYVTDRMLLIFAKPQ